MVLMDYIEFGAVILGVVVLIIGLIDYARCKRRGWGNNPPKFFSWGKR